MPPNNNQELNNYNERNFGNERPAYFGTFDSFQEKRSDSRCEQNK